MFSFKSILLKEFKIWFPFSCMAFIFAFMCIQGYKFWNFPFWNTPYLYSSDALFALKTIEQLANQWIWYNPRLGWPFGQLMYDFPLLENFDLLLLKILRLLTGNAFESFNLYILITFLLVFASSYFVFRKFELPIHWCLVGAFAYDFLPFHFERIGHFSYCDYFAFPLLFYIGFVIFTCDKLNFKYFLKFAFLLIILSNFVVYYSFFSCIILFSSGLLSIIKLKSLKNFYISIIMCLIISVVVLLTLSPSIIYKLQNGINVNVATREPFEAEIYGLKLIQMLLPSRFHTINIFSNIANKYIESFPLINENVTASSSLIGIIGFVCMMYLFIRICSGKQMPDKHRFFTFQFIVLFFIGTVGGLGTIFNFVFTPLLRCYNRISICISFVMIIIAIIYLQNLFSKIKNIYVYNILFIILSIIIIVDSTHNFIKEHPYNLEDFTSDKLFFESMEKQLPENSAIYQLPYVPFPENPQINKMGDYSHFAGYLHSKTLKWSYGAMKGRFFANYLDKLSKEPIYRQLEVIKNIGFNAIYIDRKAYLDNAENLINELRHILSKEPIFSSDKTKAYFIINNINKHKNITSIENFVENSGFPIYRLSDLILFNNKSNCQNYIMVKGFSTPEDSWVWTIGRQVQLLLNIADGTNKQLKISMSVWPFLGMHTKEQIVDVIANNKFICTLYIDKKTTFTFIVPSSTMMNNILNLKFIVHKPQSPYENGFSNDTRKLGFAVESLKIE